MIGVYNTNCWKCFFTVIEMLRIIFYMEMQINFNHFSCWYTLVLWWWTSWWWTFLTTSTPSEKKQFCGVCRTWKILIEWKVRDICDNNYFPFILLMIIFFFCEENVISKSVKVWPRHASSLNKFQFFNHTPTKALFIRWKENPWNVTKHATLANVSHREREIVTTKGKFLHFKHCRR